MIESWIESSLHFAQAARCFFNVFVNWLSTSGCVLSRRAAVWEGMNMRQFLPHGLQDLFWNWRGSHGRADPPCLGREQGCQTTLGEPGTTPQISMRKAAREHGKDLSLDINGGNRDINGRRENKVNKKRAI
jgi:hypothetical protein